MGTKKKDTGNLGDSANTNGFDKNPQNINRKGPPRRSWNNFNERYPDVEPFTKGAYFEALAKLLNMTKAEWTEIAKNEDEPANLRYMIADLSSSKLRQKMQSDLLAYLIGRPVQPIQHEMSGEAESEVFIIGGKKIMFGSGKLDEENETKDK